MGRGSRDGRVAGGSRSAITSGGNAPPLPPIPRADARFHPRGRLAAVAGRLSPRRPCPARPRPRRRPARPPPPGRGRRGRHLQSVVATGHDDGLDVGGQLLGAAHRVALALHHQQRQPGPAQLRQARALGATGRVQRERQRQHPHRAQAPGAACRRARPGRAAADEQGHASAQASAPATSPSSSVGGGVAIRRPATFQGCSSRTTVKPRRGSRSASSSRSQVSMPAPAPWLSSRVARGLGARSVTSLASPCGVAIRRSVLVTDASPAVLLAQVVGHVLEGQRSHQLGAVVAHVGHQGRDGDRLELARAAGTSSSRGSPAPPPEGSSQASRRSRGTIRGIRSWMWPRASSAAVVSTVQVQRKRSGSSSARSGSRQIS